MAILVAEDGDAQPIMGGTDLLIRMRGSSVRPARVLDVKGLPGMQRIAGAPNGWLVIGAASTMNQVAGHALVREHYALLAQACNSVASYQLRNRATLGGNLCNASPAADAAPALYCLGAVLEVFGPEGGRRIPIGEFFLGPGRSALQRGELLMSIQLPPARPGAQGVFSKLGRTKAGDISTVSVAVYAWTDGQAQTTVGEPAQSQGASRPSYATARRRWAITLGAVGPTPLRAAEAEAALHDDDSPAGVVRAAALAAQAARPIDDIRASSAYRRAMVEVLVRRGVEAVAAHRGGAR